MTRPWLGISCRTALAVALAVTALPAAAPALADDGSDAGVLTYALPPGTPLPSLAQLQADGGLERLDAMTRAGRAQKPLTAAETVGPAAAHGTVAKESSFAPTPPASPSGTRPSALAPGDAIYPEPSRKMTLDECRKGLGSDKKFFIKSRFAVCTGTSFLQTWLKNGRVKGKSWFNLRVVGTVAKSSRKIDYKFHFSEMGKADSVPANALKISVNAKITQSWPSRARYTYAGTMPGTKTFAEAKRQKSFTHTVHAKPGQGSGRLDTIFAVYQPTVTVTPPAPWTVKPPSSTKLFLLAPRWEAAGYLANSTGSGNPARRGAATFSYAVPLVYSAKSGAVEQEVAKHIRLAFLSPDDTKPYMSAKKVPGQNPSAPLHRTRDSRRNEDNGKAAIAQCKRHWGPNYTEGGKKQCDEYPFRSTLEGAAEHQYDPNARKFNFSAKPVLAEHNRDAGLLLKGFYAKNRMLADTEDDAFLVRITP
ncbi:hypothetical protein [Streptomyces sp. NPDC017941]|uniref:NucA/NucB deoxyribonuclease domain-containing protein n=1 Tax=Streptomyces sp. NPDC017941 TaxID=3365018 RepID=UPI0037999E94